MAPQFIVVHIKDSHQILRSHLLVKVRIVPRACCIERHGERRRFICRHRPVAVVLVVFACVVVLDGIGHGVLLYTKNNRSRRSLLESQFRVTNSSARLTPIPSLRLYFVRSFPRSDPCGESDQSFFEDIQEYPGIGDSTT